MKNYIIEEKNGRAVVVEIEGIQLVEALGRGKIIYSHERHAQHDAMLMNGEV